MANTAMNATNTTSKLVANPGIESGRRSRRGSSSRVWRTKNVTSATMPTHAHAAVTASAPENAVDTA